MKRSIMIFSAIIYLAGGLPRTGWAGKREKSNQPSALDRFIEQASVNTPAHGASVGSTWSPPSDLADGVRDLRASRVNDLVTIVVAERASAVAKGTTKTTRASSAKSSITALKGPVKPGGPLANLASLNGASQLAGEGTTSRETLLTTTLSARVTHVLPGGAMVIEGSKEVQVNSEQQTITVRGVIRPSDLSPDNTVSSDRLAHLEVRISGKGVVNDAVRRPFVLYRLLLGLLPM